MSAGEGSEVDGSIEVLLDDDVLALYERAPCGYLSATPDGAIIKVNGTFLTLTGYSRDDLIGRKRFVELLTAGGRIYHETHYAPMIRMHGSAREIALDLVCADGRRMPVLVNSVLERDARGEAVVIRTAVFEASHRRLYELELLREKERAEESEARATALARTLQQTLIPPHLPEVDGLEVGAQYRPAGDGSEVGGDFYDIFRVGEDEWVVVIGDVCGKGAEAAVVTALARFTLRAAAIEDPSPARALSLLNDAMHRSDVDRFLTAAVLRVWRTGADWHLVSCVAGHPLPLLFDRQGDVTTVGRPGSMMGAFDHVKLHETEVDLAPGDLVLAYTDGVTEARSPDRVFFGEGRLVESLAGATGSADDIAASLLADVLDFQNGRARDDIAIVALRVP